MTETRDDMTDIAWLKDLAQEGARAPMQGAAILFAAGLVFGLASLGHWAATTGFLPGGIRIVPWIWLFSTLAFLLINGVLVWRMRGAPGVRTAANRAMSAAWAGVGLSVFALFASIFVIDTTEAAHLGTAVFFLVPSIIMVFYGLGWAVTAAMTRSGPLWWLALASFVAAPALAALAGGPQQYLAYAGALFGLMAVPGFLLMRAAKG